MSERGWFCLVREFLGSSLKGRPSRFAPLKNGGATDRIYGLLLACPAFCVQCW